MIYSSYIKIKTEKCDSSWNVQEICDFIRFEIEIKPGHEHTDIHRQDSDDNS